MKAIVIGGTGATGKTLIDQLLADAEITSVVSLVRNPERQNHPKLQEIKINFDQLENFANYIQGDIAFSCLGTTLKASGSKKTQWKVDYTYNLQFAKIAKQNQVPTMVLLSAMGANQNAFFFYSKMKGKLEESIKKLGFDHLVLTRPSILIRPGSERTGEKIGVKVMQAITNLGLFKKYQALPVAKVAKAMIEAGKLAKAKLINIEVEEILILN